MYLCSMITYTNHSDNRESNLDIVTDKVKVSNVKELCYQNRNPFQNTQDRRISYSRIIREFLRNN